MGLPYTESKEGGPPKAERRNGPSSVETKQSGREGLPDLETGQTRYYQIKNQTGKTDHLVQKRDI